MRPRRQVFVLFISMIAAASLPSFGEEKDNPTRFDPAQAAAQYVGEFTAQVEAQHHLKLQKEFVQQLSNNGIPAPDSELPNYAKLSESTREHVDRLFQAESAEVANELDRISKQFRQREIEPLTQDWIKLRRQRNEWDAEQQRIAAGRGSEILLAFFSKDTRWLWLSALIAMLGLGFVSWHDRRHEFRRHAYGSKARKMLMSRVIRVSFVLLALVTVVSFFFSEFFARALSTSSKSESIRTVEMMNEELTKIADDRKEAERLGRDFKKTYDAQLVAWQQADQTHAPRWSRVAQLTHELLVQAELAKAVGEQISTEQQALEKLAALRNANREQTAFYENLKWSAAGIVGILLVGGIIACVVFLIRGIRTRDKRQRKTCPVCLAVGQIQEAHDNSGQTGISADLPRVTCTNEVANMGTCKYTNIAAYQWMPKLYFSTIGIPSSGKTTWLAMTYRQVIGAKHLATAAFSRITSEYTDAMEGFVTRIVDELQGTAPTQTHTLPSPLMFDFEDSDPWGTSQRLVNILDFTGEIVHRGTDDVRRRRALETDGFVFMLDSSESSRTQIAAIDKFVEHLGVIANVKGKTLRVPVALCLSKLDLLGPEHSWFFEKLSKYDQRDVSLETMEARSQLTHQLTSTLWTDWDIKKQVEKSFGGRHMFFPVAPLGLNNPMGLSQEDHSDRVIHPFGVTAPLFWLLHMNGYILLDKKRKEVA